MGKKVLLVLVSALILGLSACNKDTTSTNPVDGIQRLSDEMEKFENQIEESGGTNE